MTDVCSVYRIDRFRPSSLPILSTSLDAILDETRQWSLPLGLSGDVSVGRRLGLTDVLVVFIHTSA